VSLGHRPGGQSLLEPPRRLAQPLRPTRSMRRWRRRCLARPRRPPSRPMPSPLDQCDWSGCHRPKTLPARSDQRGSSSRSSGWGACSAFKFPRVSRPARRGAQARSCLRGTLACLSGMVQLCCSHWVTVTVGAGDGAVRRRARGWGPAVFPDPPARLGGACRPDGRLGPTRARSPCWAAGLLLGHRRLLPVAPPRLVASNRRCWCWSGSLPGRHRQRHGTCWPARPAADLYPPQAASGLASPGCCSARCSAQRWGPLVFRPLLAGRGARTLPAWCCRTWAARPA